MLLHCVESVLLGFQQIPATPEAPWDRIFRKARRYRSDGVIRGINELHPFSASGSFNTFRTETVTFLFFLS